MRWSEAFSAGKASAENSKNYLQFIDNLRKGEAATGPDITLKNHPDLSSYITRETIMQWHKMYHDLLNSIHVNDPDSNLISINIPEFEKANDMFYRATNNLAYYSEREFNRYNDELNAERKAEEEKIRQQEAAKREEERKKIEEAIYAKLAEEHKKNEAKRIAEEERRAKLSPKELATEDIRLPRKLKPRRNNLTKR